MRVKFERWKATPDCAAWRLEQERIQRGRCAWCKYKLFLPGRKVHIDHVDPLYLGGSNDPSNLVLSCARCNMRKFVDGRYVVPDWIKESKAGLEKIRARKNLIADQKRQAIELLDDVMLEDELSWLRVDRV
jgi:5-methylcytosine-specific restriction endonuclease McrA